MGLGRLAARGLTMTDARRITVGPIAAAYLEIQQGVVLVPAADYDALHAEAEALRAENGRLQADRDRANQYANQQALECNKLSTDLEAARGLLREVRQRCQLPDWARSQVDKLTATPAPEAPDHIAEASKMVEQGERQEASQDVRALVEALEECAASLAWNCFGECRAIHAGPIMPAAMALETARAALATCRQSQRKVSEQ